MQQSFFGHVMPFILVSVSYEANGAVNSTIPFSRSRWSKGGATRHFWSCDAIGISTMWCHWHHQLHHSTCLAKMITRMCNITFWTKCSNWCWCYCHMIPTASSTPLFHFIHRGDQKGLQFDSFDHVLPLAWASCEANCIINGTTIFD